MSDRFANLVERQIQKAQAEGQLDGLEGEGKPLSDRSPAENADPALAAAHRMMAQNGVVPEEFSLKKQMDEARKTYAQATTPEDKKAAMKVLADLEMRFNIAREARRAFMR